MEQEPYVETAKEVAGKAIGRHGLIYITLIVAMGVGASIVLEKVTDVDVEKIREKLKK